MIINENALMCLYRKSDLVKHRDILINEMLKATTKFNHAGVKYFTEQIAEVTKALNNKLNENASALYVPYGNDKDYITILCNGSSASKFLEYARENRIYCRVDYMYGYNLYIISIKRTAKKSCQKTLHYINVKNRAYAGWNF